MNAAAKRLQKRDVVVLSLTVVSVLLTLEAVGQGGRWRAEEGVCLSNLGQWGTIFQGYVERNNGKFFSGDKGGPGFWWVKGLDDGDKDWTKMGIWFCPRSQGPLTGKNGMMTVTMPSIFNAWGVYSGPGMGPNGVAGSYGLNGYMLNIDDKMTYTSGVPASQGWRDLTNVPGAANVPMFLEALRFDLWPRESEIVGTSESAAWSATSMARCCINRHDGTVCCLFVDGSVRKVGLKELWTLKWHKSFNTAGPWTKAGGAGPDNWPAWMRPFKDF